MDNIKLSTTKSGNSKLSDYATSADSNHKRVHVFEVTSLLNPATLLASHFDSPRSRSSKRIH